MTNINPILAAGQQPQGDSNQMLVLIVVYGALFAALYFFVLRPNSKKKKEEAEMRNALEIGDEITTIGGIMGRIVAIKDEEDALIIETGPDRVKMKFKKWCISSVDTVKEAPESKVTEKKGFFGRKNKDENEK